MRGRGRFLLSSKQSSVVTLSALLFPNSPHSCSTTPQGQQPAEQGPQPRPGSPAGGRGWQRAGGVTGRPQGAGALVTGVSEGQIKCTGGLQVDPRPASGHRCQRVDTRPTVATQRSSHSSALEDSRELRQPLWFHYGFHLLPRMLSLCAA